MYMDLRGEISRHYSVEMNMDPITMYNYMSGTKQNQTFYLLKGFFIVRALNIALTDAVEIFQGGLGIPVRKQKRKDLTVRNYLEMYLIIRKGFFTVTERRTIPPPPPPRAKIRN